MCLKAPRTHFYKPVLFWLSLFRHSPETVDAAQCGHVTVFLRCDWLRRVGADQLLSADLSAERSQQLEAQRGLSSSVHTGPHRSVTGRITASSPLTGPRHRSPRSVGLTLLIFEHFQWCESGITPRLRSMTAGTTALCWTATRTWSSVPAGEQRGPQPAAARARDRSEAWGNHSGGKTGNNGGVRTWMFV